MWIWKDRDVVVTSTYLLTESDHETTRMTLDKDTIKFWVNLTKEAIDAEMKDESVTAIDYEVDELMNGVNNIAIISLNKLKLVEAGVLPLYVRAIKSDSENLRAKAAQGIRALPFNKEAKYSE